MGAEVPCRRVAGKICRWWNLWGGQNLRIADLMLGQCFPVQKYIGKTVSTRGACLDMLHRFPSVEAPED
jgi:hypothetical protein